VELFGRARRVGVPYLAVRTADQWSTMAKLVAADKEAGEDAATVAWDAARGYTAINDAGDQQLRGVKGFIGFVDAMSAAAKFASGTVVFVLNAHRQLHTQEPLASAANVQAVCNLRSPFKNDFRMLVLLGPAGMSMPQELSDDVVMSEDALPTDGELRQVVSDMYVAANESARKAGQPEIAAPDEPLLTRAATALSGTSEFSAEQSTALSMTEAGLDLEAVWEQKIVAVSTRGLSVWRGRERFSDIVGLDGVKARLNDRISARTKVGVVVFMDEIDKMLANVEHDTSGVRTDQLLTLLTEMENNEWKGMICVGIAGAGKSLLGKALGNEAGTLTLALDLAGTESKYVGESEAQLRHVISVIKRVGGGNAYFMATSNNASVMRPELQRRFTDGTWMFDLLSQKQRLAAWKFYMGRYELPAQPLPADDGWTPAEIRNCCRDAWDTGQTLVHAAQFILPMAQARADAVEQLRQYADGRMLDAAAGGTYRYTEKPMAKLTGNVRGIKLSPGSSADN
jgi:hypothetical protein